MEGASKSSEQNTIRALRIHVQTTSQEMQLADSVQGVANRLHRLGQCIMREVQWAEEEGRDSDTCRLLSLLFVSTSHRSWGSCSVANSACQCSAGTNTFETQQLLDSDLNGGWWQDLSEAIGCLSGGIVLADFDEGKKKLVRLTLQIWGYSRDAIVA